MSTVVDKLMNSQLVQLGLAALAFLIALWLVVVIARMLMGGRLRLPGGRTRQARLGIVDAFDLDRQRQLIIVRRDNTEHLIMIGGPNDIVIESEIVRVEARDFRDGRRDKNLEAFSDARVPAPFVASPADAPVQSNGGPTSRHEEPLLPMPLPQMAPSPDSSISDAPTIPVTVEPQAPRPTFPLPPRRPAPPVPERRTAPPPAPERTPRSDEPGFSGIADAPLPPPSLQRPQPVTPPSSAGSPAAPGAIPMPAIDETARPAPARPAPFLKPLPPRVPPRPLKRVTPQPEPADAGSVEKQGGVNPPPPLSPASRVAPIPPVAAIEPSKTAPDEQDGLASLEEEMAKLLGR